MSTVSIANTDSGLSGKTVDLLESDQTITGKKTFSRGAQTPFDVAVGSTKVSNLDADKVDGIEGSDLMPKAGGTFVGDVLFTDGLYDLGKTGATRPRDGFFSRNVEIGGTLAVTGVITATAGQIVFPAAQNASAGANILDDFEEGSWTPVWTAAGGSTASVYDSQIGRYQKVGKWCNVQAYIDLNSVGSLTGQPQIGGLPFTTDTTASFFQCGTMIFFNLNANKITTLLLPAANGTVAAVWNIAAAALSYTAMTNTDVISTTQVAVNLTYVTTG